MSAAGSSVDVGGDKTPGGIPERKTRSCAECRRRRIRCDGFTVPCSQCVYYQVVDRCFYPQRRSRRAPTTKAFEDLSHAHDTTRGVLHRIFPGQSVDHLQTLSRDELLSIASVEASKTTPSTEPGGLLTPAAQAPTACDSPTASMLGFEPSRIQEFVWDETVDGTDHQLPWEDDVNGMTALFDTESGRSYLGISSVPTILHVMAHTSPQLRQAVEERKRHATSSLFLPGSVDIDPMAGHPIMDESSLIDAYFRIVHVAVPMIDEITFRQCFAQGGATGKANGPWLALLNMVLTLGYIALHNDGQAGHAYFADRASEHLNMSCFATGHIYTLQALIIFGGYYLHFLNKPNMASAVMGAAHRMALAMGLHHSTTTSQNASAGARRMAETRTRTWWCLFCLDTWAGTTLGRPLSGAGGPANLAIPSTLAVGELDYDKIALSTSVSYSIIAARIQDRMAQTSLIPPAELNSLDRELLAWHERLHPIFRSGRHGPEPIRLASLVLQFRYLNLRMLLYRPYLLVRSIKAGTAVVSSEKDDIISLSNTCCSLAQETIEVIIRNWYPNQMLAWNASWFLFQACLVLLLWLLSSSISPHEAEAFGDAVKRALNILTEMRPWRGSAAQTQDLIMFIFSARTGDQHTWETNWSLSDDELMTLLGFSGMVEDGTWT